MSHASVQPRVLKLKYTTTSVRQDGICILEMRREPTNSLNLEFWDEMNESLTFAQADQVPKAYSLVICSTLSKPIFSAGNDLNHLYVPTTNKETFVKFWTSLTRFLTSLYASELFTCAAIYGFCAAAGTGISLCCDLRIADPTAALGLNEAALGIPPPKYWSQLLINTIGQRQAEKLLTQGLIVNAAEAMKLGLVDRVVDTRSKENGNIKAKEDREQIMNVCIELCMHQNLAVHPSGRKQTKMQIRKPFADAWYSYGINEEPYVSWKLLSQDDTIAALGNVIQNLKTKKKNKRNEGEPTEPTEPVGHTQSML